MLKERSLPRVLESTVLVRFQDCDPFGHLNNARYIDYFLNTREDQLRDVYDLDIFAFGGETGQSWVVHQNQIAYLAPARFMETVRIRTQLIHSDQRRLVVEGLMLDEGGQRLKAVGWVAFTFVDMANGRPARHPQHLMQLFADVAVDGIYEESRFEARVAQLKVEFRSYRREQVAG